MLSAIKRFEAVSGENPDWLAVLDFRSMPKLMYSLKIIRALEFSEEGLEAVTLEQWRTKFV